LANTYYLNESREIIRLDRRYNADIVAEGVMAATLAKNGETLVYLKNGSIYKNDNKNEPVILVNGGAAAFTATAKGDAVYYLDTEGKLFYQKGEGNPVLVTDDWRHDPANPHIPGLFRGNRLVYISGYDLHIANAGRHTRVRGLKGDVTDFGADPHRIWVRTSVRHGAEVDHHFYYSTNGTRFTFIGSPHITE
jgi:hypothetical protein